MPNPPEPEPAPEPPESEAADDEDEWVISTRDDVANEEETEDERGGILGRTVGAILGVGPGREGEEDEEEEADETAAEVLEDERVEPEGEEAEELEDEPDEPEPYDGEATNLNQATFEELRDIGFSVTQATRVIIYRDREGGFSSLEDLADVPGMPGPFLLQVKPKLTL